MSLTGARPSVSRLTALRAAADCEWPPAARKARRQALTRRGEGYVLPPHARHTGERPPRPERAARRPARAGPPHGRERGVQRPGGPAEPVVAAGRRAGTSA